jgi:hypothetical protein
MTILVILLIAVRKNVIHIIRLLFLFKNYTVK